MPLGKFQIYNRVKPWGTAHAVWTARKIIVDDFIIINADDYYGYDAFSLAANFIKHNSNNKLFGIISYSLNETLSDHGTVSRGICKIDGIIYVESGGCVYS